MKTLLAILILSASLSAQTTTRKLAWDQPNVATAAEAQALVYTLTIDARPPAVVAQTCVQATPSLVSCTTPLTALGAGKHTLTLQVDNGFDSAVATLSGASPSIPSNLKISITVTVP